MMDNGSFNHMFNTTFKFARWLFLLWFMVMVSAVIGGGYILVKVLQHFGIL